MGGGAAIVDIPARDLSDADLESIFTALSPMFKTVYRASIADAAALRAWLITSGLYADPVPDALPAAPAESE